MNSWLMLRQFQYRCWRLPPKAALLASGVWSATPLRPSFATIRLSVTISICERRPRVGRVTHANCDAPCPGRKVTVAQPGSHEPKTGPVTVDLGRDTSSVTPSDSCSLHLPACQPP